MTVKEFINYLIENNGFVAIRGELYRNGNTFVGGVCCRRTFRYHSDGILYKWRRYNEGVPPMDKVMEGLDIAKRTPTERKRILSELTFDK